MARGSARGLAAVVLLVAFLVSTTTAAVLMIRHQARDYRTYPAAPPPADLCALLEPATVERLVPRPARSSEQTFSSHISADSDAGCGFRTDGPPPAVDRYGSLTVRVYRHGQVSGLSSTRRAEKSYDEQCASVNGLAGQAGAIEGKLGDEACLVLVPDSDGTVFGYLRVRRAADLLYVDYYIHPGTPREVETAVADISRAVLRAL